MFALEEFTHNFNEQFVDVINSNPTNGLSKENLIPRYNQILLHIEAQPSHLTK